MSLSPAEQLLYSTTRITTYKNGSRLSFGTGFFYSIELGDGRSTTVLISNRHVFANSDRLDLSLPSYERTRVPSKEIYNWQMDFEGDPIGHPNPEVDLAAFPINPLHWNLSTKQEAPPFFVSLNKDTIPSEKQWNEFDAIEDVTMIGCPNGLFDEVNNLPIFRRGITATHLSKHYQGRNEFMVDIACFPGSSGSPVFLYSTGATYDRQANGYSLGNIRILLLGILYAGPTFNNRGEIVLAKQPIISVSTMMHLGMAIKSTELFAFEEIARQQAKNN
ncbi:S1 family peptidase [Methylorubrum aminovorans]